MAGYYGKDLRLKIRELIAASESSISNHQSWLHTGDIGYLDEDGDLWVVQRRSDIIISGGENVYPAEIEGVLRQHPAVSAVCVVGVPHPEWGEQVAAAIVLKPGFSDTPTETLTQFCRQQLAGYKQPRKIKFLADLPKTASGKIARREVADLMQEREK
jgi:O-succinylbenzoic acid--CoA ligase